MVNLWCLASANGGVIPSLEVVAFKLRMKPDRAAAVLADLTAARILDKIDGTFRPHDWDERQFKSDSSTERVKRYRKRTETKNETFHPPFQKQDQITDTETDNRVGKRASALAPPIIELAETFLRSAGVADLRDTPPQLCGCYVRADLWHQAGYSVEMVETITRKIMSSRNDIPATAYFEKAFSREHASRSAALPISQPNESFNGKSQYQPTGALAAIRAIQRRLESQDDCEGDRGTAIGLPAR